MAVEGKVKTLYSDKAKSEALFPRTKVNAISDNEGKGLNAILDQMQTKLDNAATEAFVKNEIANAQLGGDEGGEIDLSGFATKDDITILNTTIKNIDFPVDSINGKTGAVSLSASDIGARSNNWMPTASDVGAVSTSRTINGKALSSNISLNASDVGALEKSKIRTAFSQTNADGNYSLDGITSYPSQPGVYRVIQPIAGLPSGILGYGCLVIFDGGSYYIHLYRDANGCLYEQRDGTWTRLVTSGCFVYNNGTLNISI